MPIFRNSASLVGAFALTILIAGGSAAQEWPPRQTNFVIGFGAGSAADLLARVVAEAMQKKHGRPFIVENKAGAGGNISVDAVIKGPFDGSVLLVSGFAPIIVNPLTMPGVKFDPAAQLVPLTIMGTTPSVVASSKKLGVKSMGEFRELLKKNPDKYSYSTVGPGTIGHLSMEMLADQSGSKMVHVPFRGTPEALSAVIRGDVDVATIALGSIASQLEAGEVIPLAITSAKRWPGFPDIPTVAEAGTPDMPVDAWMGVFAPTGVPKPILDRITAELRAVIAQPDIRERIIKVFYNPSGVSSEEFAKILQADREILTAVIKKLDLQIKN